MSTYSPRRGGRLQHKFFIALLIVGILPGIAALTATYLTSIDSLKHSIGSGFQEIARSTAIQIGDAVDTEITVAERLAGVPIAVRDIVEAANRDYAGRSDAGIATLLKTRAADWGAGRDPAPRRTAVISPYLRDWAANAAAYVRVVITDGHGALVGTTDPMSPYLLAGEAWWREASRLPAGSAYVSSLHDDPAAHNYVFAVGNSAFEPARAI